MPDAAGSARIAAVDIGSNTTRLLVADVERDADGSVRHTSIDRRTTITRLAEGVDERGILLPLPITRVRNALVEYRRAATDAGAVFVLATATSAVRDADNGDAFLGEIEHGFGFRAQLLSGDEEAAATWAGVTSDPATAERAAQGTGLLLDIGGGSTEVLLSERGAVVDRHSFQLGSVRVTERFLAGQDVPEGDALRVAREHIRAELRERFPDAQRPDLAIGVAGTTTTVSAILLDREVYDPVAVHGYRFSSDNAEAIIDRLASLPLEERRGVRGLEPDRAPVIVAGLLILAEVLAHFDIATMETSERDILDGVALMAGSVALDEGIDELPRPFGNTVC